MRWDVTPTRPDVALAERVFNLIDESQQSLRAGEVADGLLDENDCRGFARMMKIDEDAFWRLLKKFDGSGDGRVNFDEWITAVETIFSLNKMKRTGPMDMDVAMSEALVEMQKDNWRGKCVIRWKGRAPGLYHKTWVPIIESWDCFDVDKGTIELVYEKDGRLLSPEDMEIRVSNLNEHCPSNPRSSAYGTWDVLKKSLMFDKVEEVYIVECSY